MTKTLRDVASVLYDIEHSVSCKICVKCKTDKENEHLSCLDCIEDGLRTLIDKSTPKKIIMKDDGFYCPECGLKIASRLFDAHYCNYCGQRLER